MLDTVKAQEGDLIELKEDLPKYDLKRGQRGFVIEAFYGSDEAYDIEFEDEQGEFVGLAYSVKPSQIANISATAKAIFERGIELFNTGKHSEAERKFRQAIDLVPSYISVLHNSVVRSFDGPNDWQQGITAMQFVLRLDPKYEIARRNLAIAFQQYAIQRAKEGDNEAALEILGLALSVGPPDEIVSDIKNSFAAVFTSLGIQEYQNGQFINAVRYMSQANIVDPTEKTRNNLGVAYAHVAKFHLNAGRFREAIESFERAEFTGLLFPQLLNDYGVALIQDNRLEEAVRAFERAMELDPDNTIIQANLSLARKDAASEASAGGVEIKFQTEEIHFKFHPALLMQQHEYSIAV